jgi:hypothetical protein
MSYRPKEKAMENPEPHREPSDEKLTAAISDAAAAALKAVEQADAPRPKALTRDELLEALFPELGSSSE